MVSFSPLRYAEVCSSALMFYLLEMTGMDASPCQDGLEMRTSPRKGGLDIKQLRLIPGHRPRKAARLERSAAIALS